MSEPRAEVEPPAPHRRWLGVALLLLFTAALVAGHGWRWHRHRTTDLSAAYAELAQAVAHPAQAKTHALAAQDLLADAVGGVVLDAEAIVALDIAERLPAHLGEVVPAPQPPLDADAVAAYADHLLQAGRPAEAAQFLRRPELAKLANGSVRTLQRVAERWAAACATHH